MSVTFHSELDSPTGFRVGCSCEDNRGPVFGTYADAEAFYVRHDLLNTTIPEVLVGCWYAGQEGYCEMGQCFISAVYANPGPELNVANGNAIVILEALGLGGEVIESGFGPMPADCSGSLPADDFLGRVLAAEIMSVGDPGTETETFKSEGSATVIAIGRREGYTDEKLAVLREIAEFAQAHGRAVVWG
jgi:hypothetical protein